MSYSYNKWTNSLFYGIIRYNYTNYFKWRFVMEKLKKENGTFLTDEEMKNLQADFLKAGKPIEEYLNINELEGHIFTVLTELVEIVKADVRKNEIIFSLRVGEEFIFETNAIYPLSKMFDKKNKISSLRFYSFLEWCVLKNIDRIDEFFN